MAWLGVQYVHRGWFLYHDAWRHNFPRLYSITKLAGCGDLPRWNGSVDSGWPVIIETVSSGLTNPIRLGYLFATGCLRLDLVPALYLYKAQILAMWLVLAAAMYVLGRTLFSQRLSAVFLFAAVLFAGVGLDDLHSDQDGLILFWLPWILICAVLAHRHRAGVRGAMYFNALVLFLCIQAFDHYPHFPLVIASVGAGLYAVCYPRACTQFVRRHYPRLWPALIMIAVTGLQMSIFRDAINGYVPSQRGDLIVDLSQNGETGWVQPSVLLTSFLPLGTLAGFDALAGNMRDWLVSHGGPAQTMFIYRPNSLIYYMGFIPTALGIAFALRHGAGRVRLWWVAFTLIIFAISIQETHISYVMFYLPFFNVFRTYSLFGLFFAFAVLIMGGYGLDALLSIDAAARRLMLRRGLLAVGAASVLGALFISSLLLSRPGAASLPGPVVDGLKTDALIAVSCTAILWLATRSGYATTRAIALIGATVVCQNIFTQGVYDQLGIGPPQLLEKYHLNDDDAQAPPASMATDPNSLRRQSCDTFAACYVSRRDGVSLHTDEQGTFLRNPNEPVFQAGLNSDVIQALDGVTHPIVWFSSTIKPYASEAELVNELNTHQTDIDSYLDQVTYIPASEQAGIDSSLETSPTPGKARLLALARGRDVVRLTYASDTPAYLTAAINYDPSWTARVNGTPVQLLRANFNDLLVPVAPGSGEIVLAYRSRSGDFFFFSRYALVTMGIVMAMALAWGICRGVWWVRSPQARAAAEHEREEHADPQAVAASWRSADA